MSARLVDTQIEYPPPSGMVVFVPPDNRGAPILDMEDSRNYWVDYLNYSELPPPPPGAVYMAVSDYDYRQSYSTGRVEVRTYPALSPGEDYRVITSYLYQSVVPDWCIGAHWLTSWPYGPSARECDRRCLFRDGCAACNPDTWRTCVDGYCSGQESFRVPATLRNRCLCYSPCGECGDEVSQYNLNWTSGEERVCDDCLRCDYGQCDHCSSYVRSDDLSEHEGSCRESCSDDCCRSDLINDYSYTPYFVFRGEDTYHLGIELELSTEESYGTQDAAQEVIDSLGDLVYLKEDTSIGDGFEVVTHPMSFAYASGVDWSVLDFLRTRHHVRATESCGLHIHVSKTAFDTVSHTYRWMRFIYRNSTEVQALARRSDNEYAEFTSHMNDWSIHYASVSKDPHRGHTHSPSAEHWYAKTPGGLRRRRDVGLHHGTQRYAAINVENRDTFEMRFFASTTRPGRLRAAIQFAHASIEYTRQLTANKVVTQKGLDFDTFRAWLDQANTGEQYADLISEIKRLVG